MARKRHLKESSKRRQLLGAPASVANHRSADEQALTKEVLKAFRSRGHAAIDAVAAKADANRITRALAASTDIEAVLVAFEDVEGILEASNKELAAIAEARLRGVSMMRDLLFKEGAPLKAVDVAKLCGISEQAINKRREKGSLLAVKSGRREYFYPSWQFDDKGETLMGLRDVLRAFKIHDAWMQLNFFLTSDIRLSGSTPLMALRDGKVEAVKKAAAMFGEHGAA
jgi:hypothetical protein